MYRRNVSVLKTSRSMEKAMIVIRYSVTATHLVGHCDDDDDGDDNGHNQNDDDDDDDDGGDDDNGDDNFVKSKYFVSALNSSS